MRNTAVLKKKKTWFVITYMWNLKIKQTSEYTQAETDSDTENKLEVTSREEGEGGAKQGQGIQRHKLLCVK